MQLCSHVIGWLKKLCYFYWNSVSCDCIGETSARFKQQWQWRSTQYVGKTLPIYYYHVPLWSNLQLLHGLHMSDVSGYLMVSAKASCHDITCESVPGSPPPFLFFCQDKGRAWERDYSVHAWVHFHTPNKPRKTTTGTITVFTALLCASSHLFFFLSLHSVWKTVKALLGQKETESKYVK